MTLGRHIRLYALALATSLMLPGLTSCFTGVESTPRITARDVNKKHANATPETELLASVAPAPVSTWHRGKEFYVADNKIALIFTSSAGGTESALTDSLAGSIIRLESLSSVKGITGVDEAVITFTDVHGKRLVYRPGIALDTFVDLQQYTVPFTVEMSVVEAVDSLLRGNTYYYLQSRRLDANGAELFGPRYQPVTITRIVPGTENQPLRVYFRDVDGNEHYTPMTVGQSRTATRNFNTLFAMSNPRQRYRDITDKIWELIVNSKVQLGMTTQECLLALGAPTQHLRLPSTGGMVERWNYDNGTFLYFEDGHLARYRR